jgi:hypothetical protein
MLLSIGGLLVTLSQLQEAPLKKLISLIGLPSSGKTTFCHQSVLTSLAMDRSLLYMLLAIDPSEVEKLAIDRRLIDPL